MCRGFGHISQVTTMKATLLSCVLTVFLNRTLAQYIPNIGALPAQLGNSLPVNPVPNNIQVNPTLQEIAPSLQFGDINMAGEMPIGGSIRVRGCFPVYGIVGVDGIVPSLGTAIVTEVIGNQVIDVVNKCANQLIS